MNDIWHKAFKSSFSCARLGASFFFFSPLSLSFFFALYLFAPLISEGINCDERRSLEEGRKARKREKKME